MLNVLKPMEISIKNIVSVEKQRGRSSNTLKVTIGNGRVSFVPEDEGNIDYRVVKEWVNAGNTIFPPPPKPISKDRPDSAYLPHPILSIPADEQSIWRYMSFEQFVSLLSRKALWFTRGNVLKNIDPYEGVGGRWQGADLGKGGSVIW